MLYSSETQAGPSLQMPEILPAELSENKQPENFCLSMFLLLPHTFSYILAAGERNLIWQ